MYVCYLLWHQLFRYPSTSPTPPHNLGISSIVLLFQALVFPGGVSRLPTLPTLTQLTQFSRSHATPPYSHADSCRSEEKKSRRMISQSNAQRDQTVYREFFCDNCEGNTQFIPINCVVFCSPSHLHRVNCERRQVSELQGAPCLRPV